MNINLGENMKMFQHLFDLADLNFGTPDLAQLFDRADDDVIIDQFAETFEIDTTDDSQK